MGSAITAEREGERTKQQWWAEHQGDDRGGKVSEGTPLWDSSDPQQ